MHQLCIFMAPEQGILYCNITYPKIRILWSATFKSEKHNIMRLVRKVLIKVNFALCLSTTTCCIASVNKRSQAFLIPTLDGPGMYWIGSFVTICVGTLLTAILPYVIIWCFHFMFHL
jgi:hypothetical protein